MDLIYLFGFETTRYVTENQVQKWVSVYDMEVCNLSPIRNFYHATPRLRLAQIAPTNYNRMPGCTFKIEEMRLKFKT